MYITYFLYTSVTEDAVDLSPLHIGEIAAKAHQRANCTLRCFLSGDVNLLVRAFIVYVRHIVEYCSVVWSPSLKHDIDLIEKVQRRFTKRPHEDIFVQ